MSSASEPGAARPASAWAWGALLVAVVGAVFHGALRGQFLAWDDDINITGNEHLRALTWANLKWMFTDVEHMRRYVPLTWLNWSFDHALFGLTPWSAHAGNILLHAANAVLVFVVVRRLLELRLGAAVASRRIMLGSMLGALWWAVHPLRVEVVAWASGRIYCQTIFFLLVTTLAYLRAGERGVDARARRRWLILAMAAFAASLLTYPLALGFVAVLVVIDGYVLRRINPAAGGWSDRAARTVWREKIVFLVLTLAVLAVSLVARYTAQGMWEPPPTLAQVSVVTRVMRGFYLWAYFVWKPLVPFGLAPVYTTLLWFNPADLKFVLSALGVIGVTWLLIVRRREWPGCLALWCCHLILLSPMLGLTEGAHYPNDRYSYLEGIVGAVLAAALATSLADRRWVLVLVAGVGACAALSVAQVPIWRDSETLFRFLLQRVGETRYRADITLRLGELLRGQARFKEAAEFYVESLRVDAIGSRAGIPHFGLAQIAEHARNLPEAAHHYREAIRIQPGFADAHIEFGRVLLEAGQASDAILVLRRSVELAPASAVARQLLGTARLQTGSAAAAIEELEIAVRIEPAFVLARCNLAAALIAAGRPDEAIAQCRAALRVSSTSADAFANLGEAWRVKGNLPEAIEALRAAVRLKPDFAAAHNSLGAALAISGRVPEAVEAFLAATRANPSFALAHFNLGLARRDTGRIADAIEALTTAVRLDPNLAAAREALAQLQRAAR